MVLVDVDIAQAKDDLLLQKNLDITGSTFFYAFTGLVFASVYFDRLGATTYGSGRNYYLFKGITIPQSSVIDDATLNLKGVLNSSGGTEVLTLTVGALNNSVPVFPTTTNATFTVSQGLWNSPIITPQVTTTIPTTVTAPTTFGVNVKPIVQALVDSFDYNNDNIMFKLSRADPGGTISAQGISVYVFDKNLDITSTAELTINYTSSQQTCKPTSDISNAGAWEDTTFGNSDTNLFDELDEDFADDDVSAVRGKQNADVADTFEVKLVPCLDPSISTGHKIRIRARGIRDQIKIQLFQGVTLIAESGDFTLTGAFTTFEYTLSGGEADSITDYNDLRIRVVPSVVP